MVYICPIGSRKGMNNFFFKKSVFVKHPSVDVHIVVVCISIHATMSKQPSLHSFGKEKILLVLEMI